MKYTRKCNKTKKIKTIFMFGKQIKTRKDKARGLMFRKKKLLNNEGLLFTWKNPKIIKMYMKNTYIPLDILYLNKNFKIVGLAKNTKPLSLKLLYVNKKSTHVIETNAGFINKHKIKINDFVKFKKTRKNKKKI